METNKIMLNTKEVEFLTGQHIPYKLHSDSMTKDAYDAATTQQLNNRKYSVEQIEPFMKLTSSNDPRYDRQQPITFAINQIRVKGLNRDVREDILSDKACVKNKCLTGQYFVLNAILTDTQLTEICSELAAKYAYHTQKQNDMFGGELPEFINFNNKNVLVNKSEYTPKKPKNAKGSRKAKGINS